MERRGAAKSKFRKKAFFDKIKKTEEFQSIYIVATETEKETNGKRGFLHALEREVGAGVFSFNFFFNSLSLHGG